MIPATHFVTSFTFLYPTAINDSDQITGSGFPSVGDCWNHAFLYMGGKMQSIDTLSQSPYEGTQARAINNSGQVFGHYITTLGPRGESTYHPFIYDGNKMYELNSLIQNPGAWNVLWRHDPDCEPARKVHPHGVER